MLIAPAILILSRVHDALYRADRPPHQRVRAIRVDLKRAAALMDPTDAKTLILSTLRFPDIVLNL
jgi:hypothetical protein